MIGYTQGRFDVLHYGHVTSLTNMKKYIDNGMLIVGVATDEFCEKWKKEKPMLSWFERSSVIRALECVDLVVPYNEVYPNQLQEKINFDVFFCTDELYGSDIGNKLSEFKFKTIFMPRIPSISSTKMKEEEL
jgi:cytidyltransferase-like protein